MFVDLRRRPVHWTAVVLLFVLFVAGCSDDDESVVIPDSEFVLRFQQGQLPTPDYDGTIDVRISPSSQSGVETSSGVGVVGGEASRILTIFHGLESRFPPDVDVKRAFVVWDMNGLASSTVRVDAHALTRTFAGNATWTIPVNGPGAVSWTTPGGDFEPEPFDTFTVEAGSSQFVIELDPAMVERWVRDARSNHGFILLAPEASANEGVSLFSADATPDLGPTLTIVYSL